MLYLDPLIFLGLFALMRIQTNYLDLTVYIFEYFRFSQNFRLKSSPSPFVCAQTFTSCTVVTGK